MLIHVLLVLAIKLEISCFKKGYKNNIII